MLAMHQALNPATLDKKAAGRLLAISATLLCLGKGEKQSFAYGVLTWGRAQAVDPHPQGDRGWD